MMMSDGENTLQSASDSCSILSHEPPVAVSK